MTQPFRSLSPFGRFVTGFAIASALFLMIPACGDDDDPADPGSGAPNTVAVGGTSFSPSNLTIQVNETVTWEFNGGPHTVTEGTSPGNPPTPLFDSGNRSNGIFAFTFDTPGTYDYFCAIHHSMGMTGTITVNP